MHNTHGHFYCHGQRFLPKYFQDTPQASWDCATADIGQFSCASLGGHTLSFFMTNRTENGSLLFFSAGQEDCQSLLCKQDTVTIVHVQQDIWPGRGRSASAPGLAIRVSFDSRFVDKQGRSLDGQTKTRHPEWTCSCAKRHLARTREERISPRPGHTSLFRLTIR